MSKYFSKPKSLGVNVKVELDLSNYVTKPDLKMEQKLTNQNFLKEII